MDENLGSEVNENAAETTEQQDQGNLSQKSDVELCKTCFDKIYKALFSTSIGSV